MPVNASDRPSRRAFLSNSTVTAASALGVPLLVRTARGKEAPSDRFNVGAIGTSIYSDRYTGKGDHPGRGAEIGHQAGRLGNMVAVADVNLRSARFFAERYEGKCELYQDYRKLLDRDDIDLVTIGTPDHWHAKIAIDAMRAGKDVYCEKPLTLTIREGQQIIKVMQETKRIVQVGTQQRSEFGAAFLKAVAIARSGRLGDRLDALVSVEKGTRGGPFENGDPPAELDWNVWLGQAPLVPYCKQRHDFDFRWWLEYSGGQVTDWGVHHMDIALWALGVEKTGPVELEGAGSFGEIPNGFNVAHQFHCYFRYANGNVIRLFSGPNELIISGSKGRIRVNRGGLRGAIVEQMTAQEKANLDEEVYKLYGDREPTTHMQNFFDCVKSRRQPISDVESHHRCATNCHMANIAMKLERRLQWDPVKEEFLSDEQANAMRSREQRAGFEIDVA
ncbi:MAG: Gfo/Idh/MocA family oxidoreductase [Planctomycetes bacterium]|nr:Gfo/Idh/MocA family oxidoreductase [Planctomycetota bacterium]